MTHTEYDDNQVTAGRDTGNRAYRDFGKYAAYEEGRGKIVENEEKTLTPLLVAEGDSWFDLPLTPFRRDVVEWIRSFGFVVRPVADYRTHLINTSWREC